MPQRASSEARWCMFPSLHDNVSSLLEDDGLHFTFYPIDRDTGCIKSYDTNIMGKFRCNNQTCKATGWGSRKIAITIRRFRNQRYNARVYYQRCKRCKTLSEPEVDDSYADRVAYRLKSWSGVEQERRPFSGTSNGPHERSLCEGCKAGHCNDASEVDNLAGRFANFAL
ncbi:zinc-binding domain-containing protein [Leptodontidium sp. MPI-SDFR-AT-0119]|nr:zinc-binding domain-containing protein [Leptodontidium sp. MPI-SDFR-AT-0119]